MHVQFCMDEISRQFLRTAATHSCGTALM